MSAGLDAGDLKPDAWTISPDGAGVLRFGDVEVKPPLRGEHNLRNAMLAVAVARALGVSMEDAAAGIARTPVLPMRSAWVQMGARTVINDAYNANPGSTRAAIDLIRGVGADRQRVAAVPRTAGGRHGGRGVGARRDHRLAGFPEKVT